MAHELEVLGAGEVLVDGGELAGEPDALADGLGMRLTSMSMTSAMPASGRRIVVRMRTATVLPAPLGPSSPRTVSGGTARSMPASARTEPKDLATPSARMAGWFMGGILCHIVECGQWSIPHNARDPTSVCAGK